MILGDASSLKGLPKADYVLANINKNIILGDIESYSEALKPGGIMLLSGFYQSDVDDIVGKAADFNLAYDSCSVLDNWASIKLKKLN